MADKRIEFGWVVQPSPMKQEQAETLAQTTRNSLT